MGGPPGDAHELLRRTLAARPADDLPPPRHEPLARGLDGRDAGDEGSGQESDPGRVPLAPQRRQATRKRLRTPVEQEAQQQAGSSQQAGPSRGDSSSRPDLEDEESEGEDAEPLIQRRNRRRAAAQSAATGAAQGQPIQETVTPADTAPGPSTQIPFLKRKIWVFAEDEDDERYASCPPALLHPFPSPLGFLLNAAACLPCSETVPERASKKACPAPGTSTDPATTPSAETAGEAAGGSSDAPPTAEEEAAAGNDRATRVPFLEIGFPATATDAESFVSRGG